MDGASLIARLSDTGLFRLVGGAAEFGTAEDTAPPTPAAFVLTLGEDSNAKPPFTSDSIQRVTRLYGVIQCVRNVRDASGAAATAALKDVRRPMLKQLIGWEPFAGGEPLIFMRGRLLKFQSGLLWWQDDFLTTFFSSREEPWA
jgi:hypothetical protein